MSVESSKSEDRLKAELCFARVPWLGPAHARALIERFGGPEQVMTARPQELFEVRGMNRRLAEGIFKAPPFSNFENEVKKLKELGARTWLIGDDDYPSRLSQCPDAPVLLFGKGELNLEPERMVSIVGTRRISPYGNRICKELVEGLASLDVTVVSGLAYGTDIKAHRVALGNGLSTIAVAGHGLDRVYPLEHAQELREMCSDGGMLTEFPLGTAPEKHHFPRRNRIIAGLTDCTVVIETDRKGGAMITANIAHSYERDVLAFPGRVGEEGHSGCHRLIKDHKAALIEGVEDLLFQMHWESAQDDAKEELGHQRRFFGEDLGEEERAVVRCVEEEGRISLDGLAVKLDMPVGKLSPILLGLELKGVLNSLPGKIYVLADP